MKIESSAFQKGEAIPLQYTCQGKDKNPELNISGVPAEAKSLALIMDDPDAPAGTWVHWLLWNISPQTTEIAGDSVPPNAVQGKNSWGRTSYGGPCPPSGTHHYFFKLYALDAMLPLAKADVRQLEIAMQPHIIDKCELMGTYHKK